MVIKTNIQRVYRPDINGLRAIAVAAVVLYHFGISGIGGGFAGVDIFFVISGFLMTQIIFPQVENGSFSIIKFYLARTRRIIPPLAALCLVVMIAGWFALLSADYTTLGRHVIATLLFVSNIVFAHESGYFDAAPFDKWLLHSWSLSVEWQFYILYPVGVLLAFFCLNKKMVKSLIVATCITSFAAAVYTTSNWPTQAFYLLPTRAWEMLAGAIVFLYPIKFSEVKMKVLQIVGLLGILVACLSFDHTSAWPSYRAAVPVVGTMLVIWAQRTESLLTSNQISSFLGKISYSVYLWHWPIVVAINYYDVANSGAWCAFGIVIAVLAGWVSFSVIESGKWKSVKATAIFDRESLRLFVPPVLVIFVAFGIYHTGGVPGSVRAINGSERGQFVAAYRLLHETGLGSAYRQACDFYDWNTKHAKSSIDPSCTAAGGKGATMLWGDSHAQALSFGLKRLLGNAHLSQVATSACPPGLSGKTKWALDNNCAESNRFALSEIARLRPETVILAQRNFHVETDWEALSKVLHRLGVVNVYLMGPAPEWNPELPLLVARRHWLDKSEFFDDGIHQKTIADDATVARQAHQSTQYEYVSMTDFLCPDGRACRAFLPGTRELIAIDYGHLSPAGSVYVVTNLLRGRLGQ